MYVDTHCHINENEIDCYIDNALKENVNIIVTASENLNSSIINVRMANKYPNVFACVGVHPLNVHEFNIKEIKEFKKLLTNNKVVAIGEVGLDYYYGKDNKDKQIKVFEEFLKLAENVNKPLVIHSREAVQDTIDIIKKYKVKGIIHCFSGSLEVAKQYIKMGFLLGIGGVITFKNSKLKDTIKEIPLEYLVLETDSPFLAPTPHRGEKNESKYIPIIAKTISEEKNISVEEVMRVTTLNALKIYKITINKN